MTLRLSIVGLGGLVVCGACGLQTEGEFPGDGAPDATVEGTEGDVRFEADDARTDRDDAGPPDDADHPEDGEEAGPVCGNGLVEAPEECDEGEFNDDFQPDACRTNCRGARCGDAVIDTGEECDDGNGVDTDECLNTCILATCAGGGACAAGTSETRSCPCGGTETRTCSAACTWGAWSGCAAGECTPSATETQSCGNCGTGTQSRTCGASCTWGGWSTCAGGGACAAGTSETRSC
ncbi:MAG: hypothetical protein QME96_01075, partial [Myxococcota bacterium]|nr:hypothetical protein [Myxococcota bacterium]